MEPEPTPESGQTVKEVYRRYREDPRRARRWSAANPGNRAIREEVLAHLLDLAEREVRGTGQILDLGCGNGYWLARLAEHGVDASRLHGVDLQAERVLAARTRVPGADVAVADATSLPYDSGRFDLVIVLTAASSAGGREQAVQLLDEARRVTAPDGLVVIWEPRLATPNPATVTIDRSTLEQGLGPFESRSVTLLPPLARRVGPRVYRVLAKIAFLRTHRLAWHREPAA